MTCSHPDKIKHPTKAAARAAIADMARNGRGSPDLSAYPCETHWHVGHDWRRFQKRIRRALRRR